MIVSAALVLCLLAPRGQLHIEEHGLREIAQGPGYVYVAKVLAWEKKKKALSAEITRVVVAPERSPPPRQAGEKSSFPLYQGVEWTDPRKSPIEPRLIGALSVDSVQPGATVVLVQAHGEGFELLPDSPLTRAKLDVFFAEGGVEKYQKSAPSTLIEHLGDAELAPLALAVLKVDDVPPAKLLLLAERSALRKHLGEVEAKTRSAFLKKLLPEAKKDPAVRDKFFDLLGSDIRPFAVADLAPLAELLDPADRDGERRASNFRIGLLTMLHEKPCTPGEFSLLDRFIARWEKYRPPHAARDDYLPKYLECFDDSAKGRLAVAFVETAHDTTHARGEIDLYLLDLGAQLAAFAEPKALAQAVEKIDPLVTRTWGTRKMIMGALIETAIRSATKHPQAKPLWTAVIDPHLYFGTPVEKAQNDAYEQMFSKRNRPAPAALQVELAPGEKKLLPDGIRLALDKNGEVSAFTKLDFGNSAALGEPLEWELEPYRIKITKKAERARFELTPARR